jgi:hypothetical protein
VRTFTPRQKIDQVRVNSDADAEIWDLKGLAEKCGTTYEACFPVFVVLVDDKPVAYYHATPQVVIRARVAEGEMTPRQFYEVAKTVIATSKRCFGSPLWIVHPESPLSEPELVGKIGLSHRGSREIFEVE